MQYNTQYKNRKEMLGLDGYKLGRGEQGNKEEKRRGPRGGEKSTKTVSANDARKPVTLYGDYKNGNNL